MNALKVPTIFTAVDQLSSVVSRMGGNVNKFATATQKKYASLARSARSVSSSANSIGMSAGLMGAAIVAPVVMATKKAVDFEKQMANVGTLVDTNKENMSAMGNEVLKISRKIPVPLEQLTKSLYQIRSAGVPAAQAMDVLSTSAQLSVTGLSTSEEATNALTSAINVFKDQGLSAKTIAGSFFEAVKNGKTTMAQLSESFGATAPIVHTAGVSLNDYLNAVSAMTVTGVPATQAMTEIRASIIAMEKPSTRMAYIFGKLGVKSVQDLLGKYGDLGGAMQAVEDKGKSLGINMAKTWGKVNAIGAVTLLTGMSKKQYDANKSLFANSAQDLDTSYQTQFKTAASQLELLRNNIQAFAITVGTKMLPVLTKLVDKLSPVIDGLISWTEAHPALTKFILYTTTAIGAFLLVISPIAFTIGAIAKAVELWATINLYFAGTAATATAATTAQTVAVTGFGSAVAGVTTEIEAANVAATGFFATLSSFAAPAALLAISAWGAYKGIKKDSFFMPGEVQSMTPYLPGMTPAQVKEQKWIKDNLSRHPTSVPGFRQITDPLASDNSSKEDFSDITNQIPSFNPSKDSKKESDIHIFLHDPNGNVKSVQSSGGLNIPVKVTPTTGQGGSTSSRGRTVYKSLDDYFK